MKENDRIYYYGTLERDNHLLRYWRRKKHMRWYLVVLGAQFIYGASLWGSDSNIIVVIISGMLVPALISITLYLEYVTVKLISKGHDLLYDHTFMSDFIKYLEIEYDVVRAPIESSLHTIYVSRYLLLLLNNYECSSMLYTRFGIRFIVDPYRKNYSYGKTRLDRYVSVEDIFE